MIMTLLLLQAAVQMPTSPPEPAKPPVLPVVSCNVAIAMFAPRSDAIDEKAVAAIGKIPAEAKPSLEIEGVKMIVLPHPVVLSPVDEARQRAIADARGQKVKDHLIAQGYPADRIAIRPADVDPKVEDNWGEGVLLMVEAAPDAWARTKLSAVC
jgi:hypothetical protein